MNLFWRLQLFHMIVISSLKWVTMWKLGFKSDLSGSTDSMGARFSLSTYLHWFLWSEYDIHFVSLQTHLFDAGFWWANIYKTSKRWVKGQRWKVGIVAETKDKYNLVIWFWIDVAAWNFNELPHKFICTCVFSARAPKFPLFSNRIDLVRQGDAKGAMTIHSFSHSSVKTSGG